MIPLYGLAALSLLIAWLAREPSSELFDEADSYYAAAERWERVLGDPRAPTGRVSEALTKRDACLQTGAALARKALRRMPLRLL